MYATQAAVPAPEAGLYVHVAFCRRICFYCDFNVHVGQEALLGRYVAALAREIVASTRSARATTLFLGGGTPSMLAAEQVAALVSVARERADLPSGAEVTLEANPCDLDLEYLRGLRAAGVNRLSLGVQSFDDALLRRLGRRHDSAQARRAYEISRVAGFDNVSLDLMFGLPGQDLDAWRAALETGLELAPEHLSLYCLTIEDGTPFQKWLLQGKLRVPDEDSAADMYELAMDVLGKAGYEHYEISNWARRALGRDLRGAHNLRYWRNEPYLGVGAGAHSSFAGRRYHNELDPREYVRRVEAGESPIAQSEEVPRTAAMAETLMLGLRLSEGVSRDAFERRFGEDLAIRYAPIVEELAGLGLVELEPATLRLTRRGRLLGNEVFERFLVPS